MIVDFGSRPPRPAFNPTGAARLPRCAVVYGTSAAAARAHGPRFVGFAGEDLQGGFQESFQERESAVGDLGLRGLGPGTGGGEP